MLKHWSGLLACCLIIRYPLSYVNNKNGLAILNRATYALGMSRRKLPPEALEFFKKQGAKGGKIGGAARAANMTQEQRNEAARKAVSTSTARNKSAWLTAHYSS